MAAPLQDNEKDALIARLQNENRSLIQEKSMLGLNYNHKKEDGIEARHLANNDIPVFTKVPELSTMKTDEDIDHLLIEGDNLPALVALLPTYRGKVNVIYIDPPYNTGNNDFVYNDRYVDSEDGFKHSKWLSFMKPRLQLAHEMLSDDGVIFVSIDDHEQAYLKVMMDEVFGEDNFVGDAIRKTKSTTNDIGTGFNIQHEYLVIYAKNVDMVHMSGPSKDLSRYTNPDNDPLGAWVSDNPSAKSGSSKTGRFPVTNPYTGRQDWPPKGMYWRFSTNTIQKHIDDGTIVFRHPPYNGRGFIYKRHLKNLRSTHTIFNSLDTSSNEYMNQVATKESLNVISDLFKYPKGTAFIKHILSFIPHDAIILDFFAGSGTTGQAVAELNKEDGGHRKCILITNNFEQDGAPNGIARDITSVRMKRVLTGKDWADGKKHEPLPGNLIYYRLDWQPMSTSLTNLPGMLPLSTFLGSLSINQDVHRLMTIPDNMPTLSKLVKDGHAALLTNENNKHTVLALDADTSDDFDTLDTVKAELESSNLPEGLDVAMESGFDTETYMDSGVFDHEFTFPVPDIIQIQATVKMLKKDGVISIDDNQEDHTHMNNDGNEENR